MNTNLNDLSKFTYEELAYTISFIDKLKALKAFTHCHMSEEITGCEITNPRLVFIKEYSDKTRHYGIKGIYGYTTIHKKIFKFANPVFANIYNKSEEERDLIYEIIKLEMVKKYNESIRNNN